jgi:predicted O-methyltransferase YrrM
MIKNLEKKMAKGSLKKEDIDRIIAHVPGYSKIKAFVETGTFKGFSIENMASIFPVCHTIEIDPTLYDSAKNRLSHLPIEFHLGDSVDIIKTLSVQIKQPAIWYLDAHYIPEKTPKYKVDVPLLQELKILSNRKFKDIIICDDVALFGRTKDVDWSAISQDSIKKCFPQKGKVYKVWLENDRMNLYMNKI